MKLRNIILGTAAMAMAAAFTSCEKNGDDDSEKTAESINIYQTWLLSDDSGEESAVQKTYYQFTKDSLITYLQPVTSGETFSADSLYQIDRMPLISDVLYAVDGAIVIAGSSTAPYKYIITKKDNGKYRMTEIDVAEEDTINYNIEPVSGVKISKKSLFY